MEQPFTDNLPDPELPRKVAELTVKTAHAAPSPQELREIFSLLDYTTLDGTDNPQRIDSFCRRIYDFANSGLPFPAAVCIYPPFIAQVKKLLHDIPVRVATTAAAFPGGQLPLHLKLAEIHYAVEEGADEVDVVISRGTMLAGEYEIVSSEIEAMRQAAGNLTLKVILETGELKQPDIIARASRIAILAGADFIKTSTGKTTPAATPEAMYVMLKVIADYYRNTGRMIGIKPAGGIADVKSAMGYYRMVRELLGTPWLSPAHFRIGASRLADRIAETI